MEEKLDQSPVGNPPYCRNCNSEGHWQIACPFPIKERQLDSTTGLRSHREETNPRPMESGKNKPKPIIQTYHYPLAPTPLSHPSAPYSQYPLPPSSYGPSAPLPAHGVYSHPPPPGPNAYPPHGGAQSFYPCPSAPGYTAPGYPQPYAPPHGYATGPAAPDAPHQHGYHGQPYQHPPAPPSAYPYQTPPQPPYGNPHPNLNHHFQVPPGQDMWAHSQPIQSPVYGPPGHNPHVVGMHSQPPPPGHIQATHSPYVHPQPPPPSSPFPAPPPPPPPSAGPPPPPFSGTVPPSRGSRPATASSQPRSSTKSTLGAPPPSLPPRPVISATAVPSGHQDRDRGRARRRDRDRGRHNRQGSQKGPPDRESGLRPNRTTQNQDLARPPTKPEPPQPEMTPEREPPMDPVKDTQTTEDVQIKSEPVEDFEDEWEWSKRTIFNEPEKTHEADPVARPLPSQYTEEIMLPPVWNDPGMRSEFATPTNVKEFCRPVRMTEHWSAIRYDPAFYTGGPPSQRPTMESSSYLESDTAQLRRTRHSSQERNGGEVSRRDPQVPSHSSTNPTWKQSSRNSTPKRDGHGNGRPFGMARSPPDYTMMRGSWDNDIGRSPPDYTMMRPPSQDSFSEDQGRRRGRRGHHTPQGYGSSHENSASRHRSRSHSGRPRGHETPGAKVDSYRPRRDGNGNGNGYKGRQTQRSRSRSPRPTPDRRGAPGDNRRGEGRERFKRRRSSCSSPPPPLLAPTKSSSRRKRLSVFGADGSSDDRDTSDQGSVRSSRGESDLDSLEAELLGRSPMREKEKEDSPQKKDSIPKKKRRTVQVDAAFSRRW